MLILFNSALAIVRQVKSRIWHSCSAILFAFTEVHIFRFADAKGIAFSLTAKEQLLENLNLTGSQDGHDAHHLYSAITEAANCQSSQLLRRLFAIILTSCEPADPASLSPQQRESLAEDYFRDDELTRNSVFNECLIRVEDLVIEVGGQSLERYGLQVDRSLSELCHYQVVYAIEEQIAFVDEHEHQHRY